MASQRQPSDPPANLKHGLNEYSQRAREVPEVVCIAYVPGPERDVYVYIDEDDRDVMFRLFDIERALFELFDEQLFDFHIRYLNGRPLQTPTLAEVVYARP